jgi:hypothetical protein
VNNSVVHRARLAGLVVAQWRVGFDEDILVLAEFQQFWLLQVRMRFDLVRGGDDVNFGEQVFEAADVEVRDADGFRMAL